MCIFGTRAFDELCLPLHSGMVVAVFFIRGMFGVVSPDQRSLRS